MGLLRATPVLACVVFCTACAGGGAGPVACTEIGASSGISITVGESMANTLADPTLEICDDACRTYELDLRPGSETVDLGCDSTEPEGTCSASVRPNGTLVGFVVDQLTAEEVTVAVLSEGERYSTTGTPEWVYPNGRNCPGEALQLSLTLDDGVLTT